MQAKFTLGDRPYEFQFSDDDVVNADEYDFNNGRKEARMFFLHDHGFCVAVVFADDLGEALDLAADDDKLDRYAVSEDERGDYPADEGIDFLGNYGHPFDIQSMGVIELPVPKMSVAALFMSSHEASRPSNGMVPLPGSMVMVKEGEYTSRP